MIFNLNNPHEVEKFKQYVNKLYLKKGIIEVKEKRARRSVQQNSYLHLLLGYFGTEYGMSLEQVKIDFFKRICNKDLFERKKQNKKGNSICFLRSSAELTTDEMSLAITRFRNWSASEADIYLPSAEDFEFLIYAQQCIENNKEYL
jgi:hypothetical protein